jgi:hypothetical protein
MSNEVTLETLNQVMSLKSDIRSELNDLIESGQGDMAWKFMNFPVHAPRQAITRMISRYEIFKNIINIHGNIVECGVFGGFGLMSWMHLSSIFEPLNFTRKIIGFDTFSGFPDMNEKDQKGATTQYKAGDLAFDCYDNLKSLSDLHSKNMLVPMKDKVQLVRGDANVTMPQYLQDRPETIVALLYLDFDLYEPTKTALKTFLPRMPKGAVIVFDELNDPTFPGETLAVMEELGVSKLKLQRLAFDTKISYAILE